MELNCAPLDSKIYLVSFTDRPIIFNLRGKQKRSSFPGDRPAFRRLQWRECRFAKVHLPRTEAIYQEKILIAP